jgi:hypothetical protein
MKTAKEIATFVDAYSRICGYVSKEDALAIATMLSQGIDEDDIYEKYFDATSVIDAYLLWGAARSYNEGGNIHEIP